MSNLSIATGMPVSGGEEGFLRKTSTGTLGSLKSNLSATFDPTSLDGSSSGYSIGSRWINTTTDKVFECVDSTVLAAVWKDLSSTSSPGGSSGQFQINNAGLFDGISGSNFSLGVATLPNLCITDLTSTRIPVAGTLGRLQDFSSLTFNSGTGNLSATQFNSVPITALGLTSNFLNAAGTYTVPPATNPAGSGTELQYRSGSTTFGAVTGSSVSGANVTLGGTLTVGTLTSGRIPFISTAGLLADSSTFVRDPVNGNVGIGGTPTQRFVLSEVTSFSMAFENTGADGNSWYISNLTGLSNSGGLRIWDSAVAHSIEITNAGNVLIGNTTGTNKLDVTGTGRFSSATSDVGSTVFDQSGTSGASRISQYNGAGTLKNLLNANGDSYIQGGNFGVGMVPPAGFPFTCGGPEASGAPSNTTGSQFSIRSTAGAQTTGIYLRLMDGNSGLGVTGYAAQLFADATNGNFEIFHQSASYSLLFGTAGVEAARFNVARNFGLGTGTSISAHLHQAIPAAATVGHRIDGHASQGSTNLAEWNPSGVTAETRARITSDGSFSNNQGTTGEAFGDGAITLNLSTVVGYSASTSTGVSAVFGYQAFGNYYSVSMGYQASAGWQGVSIGGSSYTSTLFGQGQVAIGYSATAAFEGSIAIGSRATTTAANQFVSGSFLAPITDVYFGSGVGQTDPVSYTIHGTNGVTGGGSVRIIGGSASAGTVGNVILCHDGTSARGNVNVYGHALFPSDNTYDIGASGATRPRNVYVGNLLVVENNITTSANITAGPGYAIAWAGRSGMYSPSDGVIGLVNTANNDFNRLQFGGTTSSFPALKRVSTTLQCRLADDSGYAPFAAKSGLFEGTTEQLRLGYDTGSYCSSTTVSGGATTLSINGVSAIKLDDSSVAGETRLQVFDVDTGVLKRVRSAAVPAVGSKVLYVDP